jgi:hypothetical protein
MDERRGVIDPGQAEDGPSRREFLQQAAAGGVAVASGVAGGAGPPSWPPRTSGPPPAGQPPCR